MLKWIKNIFKKPQEELVADSPYSGFAVEHYPITGRYYPTYKGKYFWEEYFTGIYRLEDNKHWSPVKYSNSEEEAWKIVDYFREQYLKENVKVLTR